MAEPREPAAGMGALKRRAKALARGARDLSCGVLIAEDVVRTRLGMRPVYESRKLTEEHEIREARALVHRRYVGLGKIDDTETDEFGVPVAPDPLQGRSVWFGTAKRARCAWPFDAATGRLVAVGRLVHGDQETIEGSRMPLGQLTEESRRFLGEIPPGGFAEIGSVVKERRTPQIAALALLAAFWRHAADNKNRGCDIQWFTCGLEPNVWAKSYRGLFKSDAVKVLSTTTGDGCVEFSGFRGRQVPLAIRVEDSFRRAFEEEGARRGSLSLRDFAVLGKQALVGCYGRHHMPDLYIGAGIVAHAVGMER